jgi:ribose 5-phosphate isomerase A
MLRYHLLLTIYLFFLFIWDFNMLNQSDKKQAVAKKAADYIEDDFYIGVGTGSTADYFIQELGKIKHRIQGAVASSENTLTQLKALGIPIVPLDSVVELDIYVDGADEATRHRQLIKGGGGALTREKIVASASKKFICLIDDSKVVEKLGLFPLAVEVIPMARSMVAREIVKLGGSPKWRQGFVTDNHNYILDVQNLNILEPMELESQLNQITGVVSNGIFAVRPADQLLIGTDQGVEVI